MARQEVIFAVCGLLVFGALNTLTTKIQFTLVADGVTEKDKHFLKPWFVTFSMFAGMAVVLIPQRIMDSRMKADANKALLEDGKVGSPALSERTQFLLVGIPAIFDLVASGLMFCGLTYISASIWQMLRGSMIVFTAVISVPALGRQNWCFHWVGVLLCVIGICLVGFSNVLNAGEGQSSGPQVSQSDAIFGMTLVVVAQLVQACQIVAEEKLLKDISLPPMKIVGYEGVWGSLVMLLVVFPILYVIPGHDNGRFEDVIDSFVMIRNSPELHGLVWLYVFSCATYNVSGMMVTSNLSAVHRTMLEASRTMLIWGIDLFVYYGISSEIEFGESWMKWSPVQLAGFFVLLMGQSVYGQVLTLPGFKYPEEKPMKWESPKATLSPAAMPQ